ncbi:hypothetical protein [Actinacidiphila acididurans]|uniref:Secreted protein n=1 Tax=Actinacidiphila acididurans TaxID=2784346 RepID=A0ABS2TLV2_9ACTN|nr:hypothetical protein [Actinacidiphila acididurans]MBM9504317.1 hypothetical protein [Actinacidiphila acididurans]
MIRTRIAAAFATAALAAVATTVAVGAPAEATTPPTPYMCPAFLNDGAHGLYTWTYGQGNLLCYYNESLPQLTCHYNAFSGDAWYNDPNPSYCPTRAVPTAP